MRSRVAWWHGQAQLWGSMDVVLHPLSGPSLPPLSSPLPLLLPRPPPSLLAHSALHAQRLEFRSHSDPDVRPYVHGKNVSVLAVAPNAALAPLLARTESLVSSLCNRAARFGVHVPARGDVGPHVISSKMADVPPGRDRWRVLSILAQAQGMATARELLANYGARQAWDYVEGKLRAKGAGGKKEALTVLSETSAEFEPWKRQLAAAAEAHAENPKVG